MIRGIGFNQKDVRYIMKRSKTLWILLTLTSVAWCGCQEPPEVGEIVFDCYSVNFAWGYHLSGQAIRSDGTVFSYERHEDPWLPESVRNGSDQIPADDLHAKFANAEPLDSLDPEELGLMTYFIVPARHASYEREAVGADMGGSGCSAYLFDSTTDTYTDVLLGSVGDWVVTSSSPAADTLLDWLHEVLGLSWERGPFEIIDEFNIDGVSP